MKSSLTEVTMSSELGKMVINGCITKIGKASTGAPCGTDGKLAVFTAESIKKCADTFVGMPLNCTYPDGWFADGTDLFTNHGDMNIGYIRSVEAKDDNLMAEIVVWKDKFPEEAFMIVNGAEALGFSVEWYATQTHEDEENVYMDEFQGAGCAILWKNCAAFSDTFIETLAASREKNRSGKQMNEQEKKELIESIMAGLDEKLEGYEEKIAEIKASVEKMKADINESVKASIDEAKSEMEKANDEFKASLSAIPQPKTQKVVDDPLEGGEGKTKEQRIAEINASNMSLSEKLREITKVRYGK